MADGKIAQQLLQPVAAAVGVVFDHLQHGGDVLFDGQAAKDRHLLRQIADAQTGALIHRQRGHVLTVDIDMPGIGRDQTGDAVKAGGLARAVGPQQRHHLAPLQVHRHVADHRAAAIGFAQVAHRQPVHGDMVGHQFCPAGCRTDRMRPCICAVPSARLTTICSPDITFWPWVSSTSPISVTLPEATS